MTTHTNNKNDQCKRPNILKKKKEQNQGIRKTSSTFSSPRASSASFFWLVSPPVCAPPTPLFPLRRLDQPHHGFVRRHRHVQPPRLPHDETVDVVNLPPTHPCIHPSIHAPRRCFGVKRGWSRNKETTRAPDPQKGAAFSYGN